MAFTVKTLPTSLTLSHQPLALGRQPTRSYRVPNCTFYTRRLPLIRCSTQEEEEKLAHEEKPPKDALPKPSWSHEEASADPYAGWEPLESESKGNLKGALLQVGAGFILAIGFGLIGFTTYQKLERRLKPPAPIATQQEQVSSTAAAEARETSREDAAESSADIEQTKAEEPFDFEPNKREKQDVDLKNAVGSQKQKNKKNPSPGQVSFLSEEVGDLSFDDEEEFLASAFDDDDHADVEFQQETSLNKSAKEDSKPAETGSQKEISSNALTGREEADRASKDVDSKAASNTEELVGTEALEKPGLSNKNNNSQVSAAQAGGVSRIEVPELAKKNHILETVIVSGEPTQPNKASKGNDVNNINDTRQSHEEKDKGNKQLQFSQEDVKVNESTPPLAKDHGVSSDSSAIAVPDTNKISLTNPVTETNKIPSEDTNTESNNITVPDAQTDPIKKASTVTPSQNLEADEPSEEIAEINESKIPKVGSSSPWQFSSVYIPAPSSPSAAPLAYVGKVVVPAVVDQMQEHALEALQALKVVDTGVEPGAICTRREYSRWLIAASTKLSRSPAHKVYPAMYIENLTELAFDDVPVEDPDFPFIQGLAEAGLISSNLSVGETGQDHGAVFQPDSPLSRQDLVCWKVALDRRELPGIDKEEQYRPVVVQTDVGGLTVQTLQEVSGFIDVDRVHKDARPALMADLVSDEHSIIASAFGFTRRFQPEKPTTVGQAAIALTSGEVADLVAEELLRLEAETMAAQAVAADIAMEVREQRETNISLNDEVKEEKAKREQAEKTIEEVKADLEKVKAEMDEERYSVLKDRATIDSEKGILHDLRLQVDEQLQELATVRAQLAGEKERSEKLRVEREQELETVSKLKAELEVDKRALTLVRTWAEDEAKQARAQGQILEETRRRWEGQGLEVDADLDETYNPVQTKDMKMQLDNLLHQVIPRQDPTAEDVELKTQVNVAIIRSWQSTTGVFTGLLQRIVVFLQELGRKAQHLQQNSMSVAGQKAQEVQATAGEMSQGMQEVMGDRTDGMKAAVVGMSSNIVEGSKQLSANLKQEAEKLAQRFKN